MAISTEIFIAALLTGAAGAAVGNFLLMRKMPLISDSMPHIALPGIALGIVSGFNPALGAFLFLALAVIVIWFTENRTKLPVDSIVGVLFVTALAVGSTMVKEEQLLESFFGNIEKITTSDATISIIASLVILIVALLMRRRLTLASIAPELSESIGIDQKKTELLFLVLVAATVALGINFVGVLLMSALLITPSVAARNLAGGSVWSFFVASIVIGMASMAGGLMLHQSTLWPAGILVVFISSGIFLVSVIKMVVFD